MFDNSVVDFDTQLVVEQEKKQYSLTIPSFEELNAHNGRKKKGYVVNAIRHFLHANEDKANEIVKLYNADDPTSDIHQWNVCRACQVIRDHGGKDFESVSDSKLRNALLYVLDDTYGIVRDGHRLVYMGKSS